MYIYIYGSKSFKKLHNSAFQLELFGFGSCVGQSHLIDPYIYLLSL